MCRRLADTRGQAMVEFAFVLPILVLLTIAAVEFGIVIKDWINVTDTARIAGRAAATSRFSNGTGCTNVRSAVDAAMRAQGFSPSDAQVTPSDPSCRPGTQVKVIVTRPWSVSIPLLPLSQSGNLSSTVTENVE
jgi:Flp pilus assembly protein TadG